jgi:signal transduction histidine kinase
MNDEVTICDKADEFHLKSCLQSPIYEKGIYKGSVCFEKNVEGYIWSEDIKRLLKEISKVISTYTLKIKADSVSRAKTDFLSRMSHEIRTPMNAITGMASIAKSAIEDRNKVEDCLSKIEYSTKYLISLVNNILDMSKIESGKMTILNQSFDLKKLVQEIDIIMRAQTDAKNIHFVIVENYENNILLGDELRLSQVLVNILGNAVKFTEEYGEILFKVEQLEQVSNYAVIHFSVKDSGIGISNENINRIFNSFEQAESNIVKSMVGQV